MNITPNELLGNSWAKVIGGEFEKKYMKDIGEFLRWQRKNAIIYPTSDEDIYKVFRDLPFEKVKVVIIGQDPYHDGSYNGMAFSNSEDTLRISPSLRNILKELEDDVCDGLLLNPDITLKNWQEQGVFLINTCLTVEKGKPASHSKIGWNNFVGAAIKALYDDQKPKVFILWGNHAKNFFYAQTSYYPETDHGKHMIIISPHPSPFSAAKGFFGSKPFSKTNKFLKSNNIAEIKWSRKKN